MNETKSFKKSVANSIVIGILVLASLTAMTNLLVLENGNMGVIPVANPLGSAEESPEATMDLAPGGTRGLNQDGDDYVDLERDVNGDPVIKIDGFAPGIDRILIGEPNIQMDIPVRSIKPENNSDRWGDDILYNVSVSVDEAATTYWDTTTHSWVTASNYFSWDVSTVSPDYKEFVNTGNALLIKDGGIPGQGYKYIPWFYNDYGAPGFLDWYNDGWAEADEFYRINDDYKDFQGFMFDVAGNAPAGRYNLSVEITYKYQLFQNVSEQRLYIGGPDWYDLEAGGNGDLGIFDYYFWEPYNKATPGGTIYLDDPPNVGFRKRFDYEERPCQPGTAYWEAIPDLGLVGDTPGSYNTKVSGVYRSNYDWNTENPLMWSWDDGTAGANLPAIVTNWINWRFNNYGNRQVDQYPYNVNDGNGTWRYSGYEGDTIWTGFKTEVEYVEIVVDHGIYMSEPMADNCHLVPEDLQYHLKAGDEFKKMYINVNNQDDANPMTDVYVNLTFDDPEYFSLKHDWAWKDMIPADEFAEFYYRIDAANATPVERYTGTVTLTYTREGVRITEELPMEFILYFTPNLQESFILQVPEPEKHKIIHTGQAETNVDFSVTNSGNTLLENGVLTMDFSNFKHSGDEYTDPEGGEGTYSPTIEVPYLDYQTGQNTKDLSVDVEIPYHWSLTPGIYKLLMDYEGYYFNDGVIGEPTNYVKIWMKWYDEDWDPDTDMNAYCVIDTDGDENMDIFTNDDETRPVDGIYMYMEVQAFDPMTPDLKITEVSIDGGSDTFEQGTITTGQVTLTILNSGEANVSNMDVELDLEGYFKGTTYYEGYKHTVVNPTDHIDTLNMQNTAQANLDIKGIDKYLPPGTHRLRLICQYDYNNGSTPSEISRDTQALYFNITVTDSTPDVIPTVSDRTGIIRVGDKLVDIDLYVNLANKEYYSISYVTATLIVGDGTPFIPGENATVTGKTDVESKWWNPAWTSIPANGQNLDNMYFNLNLHPQATEGTYYLNLTLDMFNEGTMTNVIVPTTLEVKIYPKIAKLRLIDVSVSTGKISPGKEFILDLTIQNDGGEAAREIYIEFKEAYVSGEAIIETYDSINPTGAKYPFSSDVIKAYIAEIQPQSTGQASFDVRGDLNIYPGVTYFQNIEFNYKDATGRDHVTTDVAPIKASSSIEATVGGEKYVWDTDREAWINEKELKSEEVMDYTPWIIIAAIIVWLITLLIIFFFIIRPRYKKEKMKMYEEGEEPEGDVPPEKERTLEGEIEKDQEPESEGEIIDYRGGRTPPPPPPPGAAPGPAQPRDQSYYSGPKPAKPLEATPKPEPETKPEPKTDDTETVEWSDDKPEDTEEKSDTVPLKGPKNE